MNPCYTESVFRAEHLRAEHFREDSTTKGVVRPGVSSKSTGKTKKTVDAAPAAVDEKTEEPRIKRTQKALNPILDEESIRVQILFLLA